MKYTIVIILVLLVAVLAFEIGSNYGQDKKTPAISIPRPESGCTLQYPVTKGNRCYDTAAHAGF